MNVKTIVLLALLPALAGCATLPISGPTGKEIEQSAAKPEQGTPIRLVEVANIADVPAASAAAFPFNTMPQLAPPPTDMIGPGDVLDINIYEAGVTLFSGAGAGSVNQLSINPGVQVQKLPPTRVDDAGDISVPYAGTLHVAGRTTGDVEGMVRDALRQMSQNPQVLVTMSQAITNSVIVSGEVANPGRLVLQTNRESLTDVLALAGGYRGNANDLMLRIVRGDRSANLRINDLLSEPDLDVRAYPGDRLMLISDPRTYSVLGASGRVQQYPFTRSSETLAEAMAKAGGTSPSSGDPAAIFVFRFVRDDEGNEVPVVYHLNMMEAGAYFLAQRFAMTDRDVIYFGNAEANRPSKLIQLVSLMFSPIVAATSAANAIN